MKGKWERRRRNREIKEEEKTSLQFEKDLEKIKSQIFDICYPFPSAFLLHHSLLHRIFFSFHICLTTLSSYLFLFSSYLFPLSLRKNSLSVSLPLSTAVLPCCKIYGVTSLWTLRSFMSPSILSLSFLISRWRIWWGKERWKRKFSPFIVVPCFVFFSPSISGFLHFRLHPAPLHILLTIQYFPLDSILFFLPFSSYFCPCTAITMILQWQQKYTSYLSIFSPLIFSEKVPFFFPMKKQSNIRFEFGAYWHACRCVPNGNKCDQNGRISRKGIVSSQFVFPISGFPNSFPVCHVQAFLSRFDLRGLFLQALIFSLLFLP